MKKSVGAIIALFLFANAHAQTIKDKNYVDKLCGCFAVEFKYAETFSPDKNYKYHDRESISGGIELTFPVEASDKRIVMQHLLVISDSMIIKHWREDWAYENPVLWKYQGDRVWTKEILQPEQVKGKWTQSVWEVSDAPRYSGASEWVTTDNITFWQNTVDAPLPRREYSVRNDYNILRRRNRLVLRDDGYVHEQDNQKIIRKAGSDQLLAEEKGINSYVRVADSKCAAAKTWWDNHKTYWTSVRKIWEQYAASHTTIALKDKVDGKVMHEVLMQMADDYATGKIALSALDASIQASFAKYVGDSGPVAKGH